MQDHNSGLQESRIQPIQGPASEKPIGYGPGEKTGAGELVDFEGCPPPNSRTVQTNVQEIKQKHQETCMEEQGASDKT